MANKLIATKIKRVDLVDLGANLDIKSGQGAYVTLFKSATQKQENPVKTEGGVEYPASAYAYTPDLEKPSTWKLRLWEDKDKKETAIQVGRAVAALGPSGFRGNKVQIPTEDLPKVKAKVLAAWRLQHPDSEKGDTPSALKKSVDKEGKVADLLKKMVTALGKAFSLSEEKVQEFEKQMEVMGHEEGAKLFSDTLVDRKREEKYQDVCSEIWDYTYALQAAVQDTLKDESADREGMIRQSLLQFMSTMEGALPVWMTGEPVTKIGRKISGGRLTRLKAMKDELEKLIVEAEGPPAEGTTNKEVTVTKEELEELEKARAKAADEAIALQAKLGSLQAKYDALLESHAAMKEKMGKSAAEAGDTEELLKDADPMVKAAFASLKGDVERSRAEAKTEREARIQKEFEGKAAGLKSLPGMEASKLAALLKSLSEKILPEEFMSLDGLLKAASEAITSGAIFKEFGSVGDGPVASGALGKLNKLAEEKVEKGLAKTKQQAMALVAKENPTLYQEYKKENRQVVQ